VHIRVLRLEGGEAVGDVEELLARGGSRPFLSPKSVRLFEQISGWCRCTSPQRAPWSVTLSSDKPALAAMITSLSQPTAGR